MPVATSALLDKVVRQLSQSQASGSSPLAGSILTLAAASYAARPLDHEMTVPTGFDPLAVVLFEGVIEAAYLVAVANGTVDAEERATFASVVHRACGPGMGERQLQALVADLEEQLQQDGMEQRIHRVGRAIKRKEHQNEVLRIAALLAHVSSGVSEPEREVLQGLTKAFGLAPEALDDALRDVALALSEASPAPDPGTLMTMTAFLPSRTNAHPRPLPIQTGANDVTEETDEDVLRVLRDDGSLDPRYDPHLSEAEVIAAYEAMVRTRVLDERLVMLQRQGRIGFHVGSLGEEATILGAAFALRPCDWIFPCYREFGAALLRGLPLQVYVDNMFGNSNDTVKGRQMPDHITCRAANFASVSSPIGTQITQAVGFGWAAKKRRDNLATLVFFGDGATSSPEFHAGMNFAGVFKTPTIFLLRNNGWAISVPLDRQSASETLAKKADAYGVPAVRCDGNDLFAVVAATRKAVLHASEGKGAMLIEALTYRMSGHSTSDDPKAYRADDEVERWRQQDPIARMRHYLETNRLWDDKKQEDFERQVEGALAEAVTRAEATAPPTLDSMFDDVFATLPWHLEEQRSQATQSPRAKKHG